MKRDFARQGRNNGSKGRQARGSSSQWNFMFLGLFLGVILAGVVFFKKDTIQNGVNQWVNASGSPQQHTTTRPKSHSTKRPTAKVKQPEPPKFEFYSMLSEGSTAVNPEAAKALTPPAETNTPNTVEVETVEPSSKHYFVQAGSFKRFDDADGLKARLLLMGFDVSVKKANHKGITWYRVMAGPFASKQQSKQAQEGLQNNGVKQTLILSSR